MRAEILIAVCYSLPAVLERHRKEARKSKGKPEDSSSRASSSRSLAQTALHGLCEPTCHGRSVRGRGCQDAVRPDTVHAMSCSELMSAVVDFTALGKHQQRHCLQLEHNLCHADRHTTCTNRLFFESKLSTLNDKQDAGFKASKHHSGSSSIPQFVWGLSKATKARYAFCPNLIFSRLQR